jgi:hypothetical protein
MIILRRFLCYPCPIRPYNGSFLSFELITIRGRFRSFSGGVPLLDSFRLVPLLWDVLYMLLLHISMRSFTFFCAWLLPCPFPSDEPGQHRRAFVTNMQVPVPISSIKAFLWCLNQDSVTDFYVLPRFGAADRHHSSTAIIVVHHFASWPNHSHDGLRNHFHLKQTFGDEL